MVPSSLSASLLSHAPCAPPALPGLFSASGLSATPAGPSWPSRVPGRRAPRRRGSWCCCCFPLSHMPSPIPGGGNRCLRRSLCLRRVGLRIACREVCSACTLGTAACTLAKPPAHRGQLPSRCISLKRHLCELRRLPLAGPTGARRVSHLHGNTAFLRRP